MRAEAEKSMSELGLDKVRKTETGHEDTRRNSEESEGRDGQEVLKCHSKKLRGDHEDLGEPRKVLELVHEHHF